MTTAAFFVLANMNLNVANVKQAAVRVAKVDPAETATLFAPARGARVSGRHIRCSPPAKVPVRPKVSASLRAAPRAWHCLRGWLSGPLWSPLAEARRHKSLQCLRCPSRPLAHAGPAGSRWGTARGHSLSSGAARRLWSRPGAGPRRPEAARMVRALDWSLDKNGRPDRETLDVPGAALPADTHYLPRLLWVPSLPARTRSGRTGAAGYPGTRVRTGCVGFDRRPVEPQAAGPTARGERDETYLRALYIARTP